MENIDFDKDEAEEKSASNNSISTTASDNAASEGVDLDETNSKVDEPK